EISVSLIAAIASPSVIELQKCPIPSEKPRLSTAASGSNTIRLIHSTAAPRVSAAPPRGARRPALGGLTTAVSADAMLLRAPVVYLVGLPRFFSAWVTQPLSPKNGSATLLQPPNWSMVNRPDGVGNLPAFFWNTDLTTGR